MMRLMIEGCVMIPTVNEHGYLNLGNKEKYLVSVLKCFCVSRMCGSMQDIFRFIIPLFEGQNCNVELWWRVFNVYNDRNA